MNSTETRDDRDSYTPLWIHPLSTRSVEPGNQHDSIVESNAKGSYRVIQKLVTASPNRQLPDAEIETALEAFVTPNGECLWRRVAVWSGPSSPLKVIHASFVLPSNADMVVEDNLFSFGISQSQPQQQQMPSLLCWAAFPERPDHKLLCVLVNPSTLSIWDVYPDSDKVYVTGEGHSVSLPFQCCAIHPLGDSHGLLLQRKEDQEDLEAQRGNWTFPTHFSSSHAAANDEEEDGFFLKVPPQNTRMTEDGTTSRSRPSAGMPLMSPRSAAFGPTEVASLFSLKHPLEDVLPIMNSSPLTGEDDEPQVTSSLVTDAFEKILYTGVLRWTDHADNYLEKKHHEQPICVTYHGLRKRYATKIVGVLTTMICLKCVTIKLTIISTSY